MWNSGQQPPAWGWPPNLNYQYSHQQVDPSQGWAAAAALWAQQRQLQEQYQNGGVSSPSNVKPPEPPGPPPAMPPLPPMPSSNSVEVHDYMHGKTAVPPTEVVDYQHGRVAEPVHGDVIDYNHGKPESVSEQNWAHGNDTWQQPSHPPPGNYYNNEQWGNEYANYYDSAPPETEQRLYHQSDENVSNNIQPKHGLSTDFHKSTGHYNKADSKHLHVLQNISGNSSPDAAALAKKTKTLPLWLRQGLEKLEKDKNKPTSEKTDNLSSKSDSLPTSPAKEKMNDSEVEREQNSVVDSDEEEQEDTRRHKQDRHRVRRSPSVEHNEYSKASSEDESEEEDEVEKQRKLMLKIKTWMTEILLGVTNASVKEICHDVYFEIKKSVKVKAKQLRRSGGLDALRMASLGDEDSASSEDDQDKEEEQDKRKSLKEKRKEIRTQNAGDLFTEKRTDKSDRFLELQEGERRLKREEQPKSYEVNDLRPHEQREQKVEKNNSGTRSRRRSSHEEANNSGNDSSSESVSRSESSDSERERRRKKSKRRRSRSESESPPKKSRKKSKRRGRESSSSDSERRKRKKKRKNRGSSSDYDSDNSSSTTKKRSRGKKHKHKARSSSRSPRRYKRKR
ncbi:arginine/serine-rich protein PNISR-like isoform X2 [Hydractinia symbiolongicarpus]|nr:arginine/serine-rich protein PNISR-like isoform X2 [Hydractinia symbiolongicarpus]XP_057307256.1 arginine/serine-rich protein PNISR-like isoform X2 [Hydractinia symbiolongicarpus]